MNQDKALRKTLSNTESQLPFGFQERVMEKIYWEAACKSKRDDMLGIVLASVTSFLLFGGALYFLYRYVDFKVLEMFSGLSIQNEFGLPISYYLCLSFIVLILLGLDYKFRQLFAKKN